MIVGFVVGFFRMLVDMFITLGVIDAYEHGSFFWIVSNINFQYFSILITIISAIVMVGVSYATKEPDYAMLKNLTFGTRTDEHLADSQASWDWRDIATSIFVVAAIIGGYVYFTG